MSCTDFSGELECRLYEASLKGETTDVEFKFDALSSESSTVHAHSVVLMAESDVFKVMLDERWEEGKKTVTVIPLPEDDMEDFKKFLKLIYGMRSYKLDDYHLVIPASKLADKYLATNVQTYCKEYFTKNCIVHTTGRWKAAGKALVLAKKYKNGLVYNGLLRYIAGNPWNIICGCIVPGNCPTCAESGWFSWDEEILTDILQSDTMCNVKSSSTPSQHERGLLYSSVRWLKHQGESSASDDLNGCPAPKKPRIVDEALAQRVIQNIRFKTMNHTEFGQSLMSLVGILPNDHIGQISLKYFGASDQKLISAYGDKGLFIMNIVKRDWGQ